MTPVLDIPASSLSRSHSRNEKDVETEGGTFGDDLMPRRPEIEHKIRDCRD